MAEMFESLRQERLRNTAMTFNNNKNNTNVHTLPKYYTTHSSSYNNDLSSIRNKNDNPTTNNKSIIGGGRELSRISILSSQHRSAGNSSPI